MMDERIIARRVTLDEFCDYMGKLEYIEGRIVTGSGIELFVGVKEFAESIRALEEEREKERGCSKAVANETSKKAGNGANGLPASAGHLEASGNFPAFKPSIKECV